MLKPGLSIVFIKPFHDYFIGDRTKLIYYISTNGDKTLAVPDKKGNPRWNARMLYYDKCFIVKSRKLKLKLP